MTTAEALAMEQVLLIKVTGIIIIQPAQQPELKFWTKVLVRGARNSILRFRNTHSCQY